MTQYVILLPGDEAAWASATPEQRAATYERHNRFAQLLEQRGHHVSQAMVVRGDLDEVTVTEGPYAETVEQLTGFYGVETDDLDDLLQVCGVLAGVHTVEVRAAVRGPEEPTTSAGVQHAGAGVV
jgi:hypothetical protein